MRAVVQRVSQASVTSEGKLTGKITKGLLVLLGVADGDTDKDLAYIVNKVCGLRIFEDENDKMNLSVKDVGGKILAVSQFTLFGDCRNGKRPAFVTAAKPDIAQSYYEKFVKGCETEGLQVECGVFRTHMMVDLTNDGPVTILLDSTKLF
ncbi:MAG: D-aminoacyl-tRNA deacylase [Phascolarctobacterium sp.]|nr:D-aminoacyl-tRNA deacylase [Phascolarctobacterium sp.]